MTFLLRPLLALERFCAALWRRLDSPRVLAAFAIALPIFFGLLSVYHGQDDNWDLRNYHRYNPYALVHGKIGVDLAPAQWQSYFNPALDMVYYVLGKLMPAPLVGFAMGALHGLNLLMVLALARHLLAAVAQPGWRLPLLLTLAACCSPGFLSELGNTMGDNMAALPVLAALLLLVAQWQRLLRPGALPVLVGAGLLVGAATGLKLTNAMYALSMCLALLTLAAPWPARLRTAVVFGLAVLAGLAATGGFWFYKMWAVFGNPLFPQFNGVFQGALAAPVGVGDTSWIPKGAVEKLLWPFIITLHPSRTIEVPLSQLIWPMLYLLFAALGLVRLRAAIHGTATALPGQVRFAMAFFVLSYLVWLNLFGIYRYLVPLELVAPLMVWLVAMALLPVPVARGVAGVGLLLAAVSIFPVSSWGHAPWQRQSFRADVPVIAQPEQSIVFTVHGDPPMGWIVPFFPKELAFVALGSGFPESRGYHERVVAMLAARRGPAYVMLDSHQPLAGEQPAPEHLELVRTIDADLLDKAGQILARYGMSVDPASCKTYPAFVGSNRSLFQLCSVNRPR